MQFHGQILIVSVQVSHNDSILRPSLPLPSNYRHFTPSVGDANDPGSISSSPGGSPKPVSLSCPKSTHTSSVSLGSRSKGIDRDVRRGIR